MERTRQGRRNTSSGDERVYALWDRLADFPAAQTDVAHQQLLKTLAGWLGADNALWVGAVHLGAGAVARRDPQHGWRGRALRYLNPPPKPDLTKVAVRGQDIDPGMTTRAVAAGAGRFRSYRLHDGFIDFAAFQQTTHYQVLYAASGISDRMWIMCPVSEDAEACYVFDLYDTKRRFSVADEALAADTLRGLKWLHRAVLLSYGLLSARTALTPTQRKVLAELLTEKTEKEIAKTLGLTPGTTHQYVVALCKKLGVNGRAGLLAAWLGQPPPPPPTDQ